jgi:hypothetical protein
MEMSRENTYHCYECGERHPRPEAYKLNELSATMRMMAFLHAAGVNVKDLINDEGNLR